MFMLEEQEVNVPVFSNRIHIQVCFRTWVVAGLFATPSYSVQFSTFLVEVYSGLNGEAEIKNSKQEGEKHFST